MSNYRQQQEQDEQEQFNQQQEGRAMIDKIEGLTLMRVPFLPNQINYLPKGGVKLAFVGHAALTDRLLDVDPAWAWEPLALGTNGLPALDECGGLWIRLTVCGITRLGYGDAGQKKGGDAMKERIGDALRNAAMRFGAALDLWHKGDLHVDGADEKPEYITQDQVTVLSDLIHEVKADLAEFKRLAGISAVCELPLNKYATAVAYLEKKRTPQTADA